MKPRPTRSLRPFGTLRIDGRPVGGWESKSPVATNRHRPFRRLRWLHRNQGRLPGHIPAVIAVALTTALLAEEAHDDETHNEALLLSDEVTPWQEIGADFPDRPKPITEVIENAVFAQNRERIALIEQSHATGDTTLLDEAPERKSLFGGNPFLATGDLHPGFNIPGGATWQPVAIAYGTARTAIQTSDVGSGRTTEWVNRIDLFTNLYLTPTERILVGIRPLDRNGEFSGYRFEGENEGDFSTFNGVVQSLFFEGDFGELFPNLDKNDERNLDYGFSIGRQPLNFQDGILINDTIDSIGISRASLFGFGSTAMRITAIAGYNQVHRGDNVRDPDAYIYGLLTSLDYEKTTVEIDAVYVDGSSDTGGDGLYLGIGDTRRIGAWSSTSRLNGSLALDDETEAVSDGVLLTSQLSRTATYNDDIFYVDTFWGIGDFTSAARDPAVGGPLGNVGILYASPGIGTYSTPLGNRVGDTVGVAVGYQHFHDDRRGSLIGEIGARLATDDENSPDNQDSAAIGLRYQRAFGQHHILQLDAFAATYEEEDFGYGLRAEWRIKF